ncbi:hypothetical protein ACFQE1_02070 [Halobium palmae]|uniref:Major facilitator superfamily (MFS) profile domain-containing protein n=1 Tax=Halobium palmae TaxID=1776492 RepID=A0ABD5RVH0_9EURY
MNTNSQSVGKRERWLVIVSAGIALIASLAAGTGLATGDLVQFVALLSLGVALVVLLYQTVHSTE